MPLIQNLIGTSTFRSQLQIAPVRQAFQITNSNQSSFTTGVLLNGRFTAAASNVQIFQNGTKLGYQDANNKDYDISPYYSGANTGFQITLNSPAYYGDYIDVTIFPSYLNDGTLKNPPGYIYQNFYDYWTSANNNLSWATGNVSVGSNVSRNRLDISGAAAFGTYGSTFAAPANSVIVSGNVGIGTSIPQQALHVAGNTLIGGALTTSNLFIVGALTTVNAYEYQSSNMVIVNPGPGPALQVTQQQNLGAQPVASFMAGTNQSIYIASSGNVAIGTTNTLRTLNVQGDINFSGNIFQNNNVFGYWGTCNASIYNIGCNVGIGMTNPAYSLDVSGTIRASADVFAYSDARLKTNIYPIQNALNTIDILRGVTYNRIDLNGKPGMGLIAQEVHKVLPEVVSYEQNGDTMSIAYGNLVGLLIEGIKELRGIINGHEERIKYLEENPSRV